MLFKNSVRTSKRTQHFTITKINWLTLFNTWRAKVLTKFYNSEVRTASIIRALEAVRISETSVNIYLSTRQYISEDSKLHTRRRENLKSHKPTAYFSTVRHHIHVDNPPLDRSSPVARLHALRIHFV
jgi:hypothetical protein